MITGLEKSKIIINALAAIGIPIVIAWVGNSYTDAIKEREIQAKFVEIAIEILNNPIDSTNSKKNLRKWSVEVINRYSGVPFNAETTKDLVEKSPLIGNEGFISNCEFKLPLIFNFDRTDLNEETKFSLELIINYLRANPQRVIGIESHSNGPAPDHYHMALSERRSKSIKDYILSRGIPSHQIAYTRGYGSSQPCKTDEEIAAMNSPEEKEYAYALNNRTKIRIGDCDDENDESSDCR